MISAAPGWWYLRRDEKTVKAYRVIGWDHELDALVVAESGAVTVKAIYNEDTKIVFSDDDSIKDVMDCFLEGTLRTVLEVTR